MAITYHAGRRIQGLSYTASNPTTSGFAQTWGKDPSNSQFEVSGGKINFLDNTSSTGDRTWLDLESIIGSAVSTTQWVLRFKFNFSTLTSGTYYYEFDAGLSDSTANYNTAQNFIGVRCLPTSNLHLWRPRVCNGSDVPRGGASDNRKTHTFVTNTDYYCEIKRTSSTDWSVSLSTTDVYGGDIYNDSYTTGSGATGLRYFKFGDAVTNTGSGFTMQGVCDVFEFYNGVTNVPFTGDTDITANYGTKSIDGSYTVLKFTESGVFTPTSAFNVEHLVVGGGGGGGGRIGGGGGAGGYQTNFGGTALGVTAQSYSITVGTGGAGGDGNSSAGQATNGYNGTSSTFSTITSIGGGGGGAYLTAPTDSSSGVNGGSGGGGGGNSTAGSGGGSTANGNNGGAGVNSASGGGGGGGAGASGATATSASVGGAGGVGLSNSITGSAVYYAGGGGGSSDGAVSAGGNGGGGAGGKGNSPEIIGVNGANGLGGGGGASRGDNIQGATGGSGVVILRFLTSNTIFHPSTSQVTSRFEETDTRKIYYKDDISWKELDGGETTNYRSDSWYEQLSGETP